MDIAEDGRWERKAKYLKLMPQHLFGGGHIHAMVDGYAHDVFLDTYDDAGIFALMAVIAIIWNAISKLRKLVKDPQINNSFKLTMLCIYVAIFIVFAVEPILDGIPWLLMIFCFCNGMLTALVQRNRDAESTQQ